MKMKLNVKSKVAVIFAVMGVLLAAGVGVMTYTLNYRQVKEQYTNLALSSARMAAALVDGDKIDSFLQGEPDTLFTGTYKSLQDLKTAFNLTYLYIIKPDINKNDGVYIFDVYTEGNDPSLIAAPGDPTGEMDVYDIIMEIYITGHSSNEAIVTDTEYGYLSSAYAPLYKLDGSVAAVVGVDISMDLILRDVRARTIQISIAVLGIIILFLVIILFAVQQSILNPVVRLSRHMQGFDSEDGRLDEIRVLRSGDELQTMAENFNRMIGDIRSYMTNLAIVTADRERIATELDVATKIQASMLPYIFPPFPDRTEFDLYASMIPAKEVGGDFYDFFLTDDNTLAVVMADVSGKGVPAALFMVIAKTLIKNNAQNGMSPKEVFEAVNNLLCENNDAGMFVTALMGYLDIPSGRFTYVNAGHNAPLIKKASGTYEFLHSKPELVLAGFEDMKYTEHEITLSAGDIICLYTDGVTEAMNNKNELFSDPYLIEVANRCVTFSVKELITKIKEEVDIFADGAEQADDITMLALEITRRGSQGDGSSGLS
jgi:sigma-B regulation protein RsbU (phosphoserine phosphatase)